MILMMFFRVNWDVVQQSTSFVLLDNISLVPWKMMVNFDDFWVSLGSDGLREQSSYTFITISKIQRNIRASFTQPQKKN